MATATYPIGAELSDPRVAELLRRRGVDVDAIRFAAEEPDPPEEQRREVEENLEKVRAVKEEKRRRAVSESLDDKELDEVLPDGRSADRSKNLGLGLVVKKKPEVEQPTAVKLGAATAKPTESSQVLRRSVVTATRCPVCKGRINTFNGGCARCKQRGPSPADLKPVEVRPERTPQEQEPAPVIAESRETEETPAKPEKLCPTCEKPCHANGRCYVCRPGGWHITRDWQQGKPVAARPPARPKVADVGTDEDPELVTIAASVRAWESLDPPSRSRVVRYLFDRYKEACDG